MELDFTDQEIRENRDSILTALRVSIFSRKNQRDILNKEIRQLRSYIKKIEKVK